MISEVRFPQPRGQFSDALGGMDAHPLEHVDQIGVGIDAVQPAGAHASAAVYSLIETGKAGGLEPYIWLKRALTDLPKAKTVKEIEALMPWNLYAHDLTMELAD